MPTNDVIQTDDKDSLLKEAASALDRAQMREDAMKVAFALVERGKIPPFENYRDFETKLASLANQDLKVVEQALALDVDMPNFGKVANDGGAVASGGDPAVSAFFHALAD